MNDLHFIIQIVMGWENGHMHEFVIGKKSYGKKLKEDYFARQDENKFTLDSVVKRKGSKFYYVYDFGDNWEHCLVVEETHHPARDEIYPLCLDGQNPCPPEDCGGIYGYSHMLEVYTDEKHPDHENIREWLGEGFDPEYFDIRSVNAQLARYTSKKR